MSIEFAPSFSKSSSDASLSESQMELANSTAPMAVDTDLMTTSYEDKAADMILVTPGQVIMNDSAFMGGHGTFMDESDMVASVAGIETRVNKLVTVKPLRARYTGEVGDVVVGRVTQLGTKRWKVDINAKQDSYLLLSSVNLPGGAQRRKSESDELQMRTFFAEGDLLSAEIQAFFSDDTASIHTRNIKYGKLRNGIFISIPPGLIKRSKSHFITLPCGVDLVLGLNGYVWVSKSLDKETIEAQSTDPSALYSDNNVPIEDNERLMIARIGNSIKSLAKKNIHITDTRIMQEYDLIYG